MTTNSYTVPDLLQTNITNPAGELSRISPLAVKACREEARYIISLSGMLASSTRVRGFKPGRSEKILSMPSEGK
jgi:hypothetical protein